MAGVPRVGLPAKFSLNRVQSSSSYVFVVGPVRRLAVVENTSSCVHLHLHPDLHRDLVYLIQPFEHQESTAMPKHRNSFPTSYHFNASKHA